MRSRSPEHSAEGLACAERHLAKTPYAQFLGIKIRVVEGQLQTSVDARDDLIGNVNLPALHGGVIGSLLDLTVRLVLVYEAALMAPPQLVNIDVDYLRTGRAMPTYGCAALLRQGRRVANVRAQLWQEDPNRPIAAARAQLLMPMGAP